MIKKQLILQKISWSMRNIFLLFLAVAFSVFSNSLFSMPNNLCRDTITQTPVNPVLDTIPEVDVIEEVIEDTLEIDELQTDDVEITDTLQILQAEETDSIINKTDTTTINRADTISQTPLLQDTVSDVPLSPAPPAAEVPIKRFVSKNVYTVEYDSILAKPNAQLQVFSGEEVFNKNLLFANKISPEKIKKNNFHWQVVIMIILAAMLSVSRYLRPRGFKRTFNALFNNRNYFLLIKDRDILSESSSLLILINYIATVALLIFHSLLIFELVSAETTKETLQIYFLIVLFIFLFYVLKYIGLKFVSFVFKTKNATHNYFVNLIIFNHIIGLMLFPFLLYNIFYMHLTMLIFTWVIFVLANIYKVYRSIVIGHNEVKFSMYYLFLYLCAVEIAPILLIIKATVNYFNGLQV